MSLRLIHGSTDRDAHPCPCCGSLDEVEPCGPRYYCGPCNYVYAGTLDEWEQWTHRRRQRVELLAGRPAASHLSVVGD